MTNADFCHDSNCCDVHEGSESKREPLKRDIAASLKFVISSKSNKASTVQFRVIQPIQLILALQYNYTLRFAHDKELFMLKCADCINLGVFSTFSS